MEELEATTNLVVYLSLGSLKKGNKVIHYMGGHGYTYDIANEGKKKLKKDVATTTGYYTGNNQRANTVVVVDDLLSLTVPNKTTKFEALLEGFDKILGLFTAVNSKFKNLCVITQYTELTNIYKLRPEQLKEDMKIGRYELSKEDFIALTKLVKTIDEFKTKEDKKIIFDHTQSAEGGAGNKGAFKCMELAEVITIYGSDKETALGLTSRKEYENPETDFNKMVTGSRWFYENANPEDYYELIHGYRKYCFGKVEPDKNYYGKLTPDVTYSALYTKEPIVILDKLFEFSCKKLANPNGYLLAGDLQHVKSKEVARLIDTYPAIKQGNNLVSPVTKQDGRPVLIELITPVLMSYKVRDDLFNLDVVLETFMKKGEDNKFKHSTFYDITDQIYLKEENKKGDIKVKLHPDFTTIKSTFLFKVQHPKAVKDVALLLSVGYDLPGRTAFNSVEDPDVKVWLVTDTRNDVGVRYCTLVWTNDFIYVHTSAAANLKVLSLAEQGRKKEKQKE